MSLQNELKKLAKLLGTDSAEFDVLLDKIKDKYTSESDKKEIDAFIRQQMKNVTADLKQFNKEMTIRMQIEGMIDILPLSYIAEKYFNKKRHWLYQKINGNIVNGKPARFTGDELKTFQFALKDISKKIGSISVSLH